MNDFRQDEQEEPLGEGEMEDRSSASMWPGIVIVALIIVAGIAIVYAHSQKAEINAMAARDASLNAHVAQLKDQLQSTTAQLHNMVRQQTAASQAAPAAQAKPPKVVSRVRRAPAHRRHVSTASRKHYKTLQARLDQQQKELKEANASIAQTRSDLQANLESTRNDLGGSIAKNHRELVALEKRDERNYFEFDLYRSKRFRRTGPIALSLRHADTKHLNYNLMMLVDDNRLMKKHVDLYEPIWISRADQRQPLEIVVNKITRNHIHGYLSAPKDSHSELTSSRHPDLQQVPAGASSRSASASHAVEHAQQTLARP